MCCEDSNHAYSAYISHCVKRKLNGSGMPSFCLEFSEEWFHVEDYLQMKEDTRNFLP